MGGKDMSSRYDMRASPAYRPLLPITPVSSKQGQVVPSSVPSSSFVMPCGAGSEAFRF